MPLLLLALIIADLFSIGFLAAAIYFWREWYLRHEFDGDYSRNCLYAAIAITILNLGGRYILPLLLSKVGRKEDNPQKSEPRKREKIQRPDGSVINIEHYGAEKGQTIIFVHGWNCNLQEWYYQRRHFEKEYRVIMMDLAGLGRSKRPSNRDFTLTKLASDLQAVIEHTASHKPFLWGHSIGGMTILTLVTSSELFQQNISGIILQHTTYTNPVKTTTGAPILSAIQKPVLEPFCWLLIALSPLVWINRWMSYFNGNSHIATRFMTFAGTQTFRQLNFLTLLSTLSPPAVTARGILGMFRYDVTDKLKDIKVPALIIAANKDRLTLPSASAFMKAHIPDSQLVTVAPANHQGLVERHAEVNSAAEKFIRAH